MGDNYKKFTDEKGRGVVLDSSTRELVLKTFYLLDKNCSSDVFDSTLELIKILIESKRARHYSKDQYQIVDVFVGILHVIISSSTIVVNNFMHKGYVVPSTLGKTRAKFDNFLHEFKK